MRISVYNSLCDLSDLSFDGFYGTGILCFRFDSIFIHQICIGFFTLADCIPDRHNLIFLHIDHGIFLYQSCSILQCNEVGRFSRKIQQQWKCRTVFQILYLSLCRWHRWSLCCTFDLIKFRLHCPLIHQDETDIWLIPGNGSYSRINPHIIINRKIIISICCLKTVLLPQYTVQESMLQSTIIIIQRNQKICRICTVDPLRYILNFIIFHFPGNGIT